MAIVTREARIIARQTLLASLGLRGSDLVRGADLSPMQASMALNKGEGLSREQATAVASLAYRHILALFERAEGPAEAKPKL